jgi:hypothetical protein
MPNNVRIWLDQFDYLSKGAAPVQTGFVPSTFLE